MPIRQLNEYPPIVGDDIPILTIALRDVPDPYHFRNLTIPDRAPLSLALKDRLMGYCERYYRNYEIIGVTIKDWFNELQLVLDENIDNFEKFLEVYQDDIAKPVLGRERRLTHTETESSESTGSGTTKDYDLPIDNTDAQEVNRVTSDSTGGNNRTLSIEDVEYMSDIGVTDNWTKLNGFLDNNPTMEMTFSGYFKNCFTIYEVIKW